MIPSNSKEDKKEFFRWRNFLIWILLALLLRWQVIEPRWIPSGSMLPTLQIKDRILIEKIRPRLTRKFNHHLAYGTVVVFDPPTELINTGYDPNAALIKRLVGIPGDVIEVKEGKLFRNNMPVNEDWLTTPIFYEMKPVQIPKKQIWVLGDNRNNSLDSHIWGALPEEKLIGTAIWRYWPVKNFGPIRFPTLQKLVIKPSLR